MGSEDATEFMIRIGMPIAAGGLVLTQTLLTLIFIMDKYLFDRDIGSPVILLVGFGLNILGIVYCFRYSRNMLGYFVDPEKKWKHIMLLVIIPIFVGTAMGLQGYQSRMVSFKKSHQIEELIQRK